MFKKFIKIIFIGLICGLLGYCAGASDNYSSKKIIKLELADALPQLSFNLTPCAEPDQSELTIFEHAVRIIELAAHHNLGFLDIGAQRFLSETSFQIVDQSSVPICRPKEFSKRISVAFEKRGMGGSRLVDYQLTLASQLTNPGRSVVGAVADLAFSKFEQASEDFPDKDIRPYARFVLASIGGGGDQYAQLAFDEITRKDAMGTGAAQIAVANGHPGALQRVKELMDELLLTVPIGKAVPRGTRNRLYELAHAISFAGSAGKHYSSPISTLMHMQVEGFVPHFGMLEMPPKRMCEVLKKIEGKNALNQFKYCFDEKIGFEY
jgi:hypothetical protein